LLSNISYTAKNRFFLTRADLTWKGIKQGENSGIKSTEKLKTLNEIRASINPNYAGLNGANRGQPA